MTKEQSRAAYIERLRAAVPEELKARRAWLCWRSVPAEDRDKPRKFPLYVNGAPRGKGVTLDSPADREQLATFEAALAAYERGNYTGLGIALGEGISGIDLDNLPHTDPRARQVLAEAKSYAEVSPSGTGLKIFGLGDIGKISDSANHLEIYSQQRFFAVTGEALDGASALNDLSTAAALARQLFLPAVADVAPPAADGPLQRVTEGRHNYLVKVAGRFRHAGLSEAEVLAALRVHNQHYCDPPRADRELQDIAKFVGGKPTHPVRDEAPPLEFRAFTEQELLAPPREERYLLPGLVPTEAYTAIAGALASFKTMLALNMIVWRATGYDLLGLAPGQLDIAPRVGDVGPALLISYEDVDWRIFARLQRILVHGAEVIRAAHGAAAKAEFLTRAAANIRRLTLSATVGNTLVVRGERGNIEPNYHFLNELLAAMRAFTSEGLLVTVDPLRLAIVGSQNDDDGADIVVALLNMLATAIPDSGLTLVTHTSKTVAKETAESYIDASYGTSGSALYSQHARSNFLLARLKADEIRTRFNLPPEAAERQSVARLMHGRLAHGAESAERHVLMRSGLLSLVEPRDKETNAATEIDRALPLVAEALTRLRANNLRTSATALVQESDLKQLGNAKQLRAVLTLLEENEYIHSTGSTTDKATVLTPKGEQRLAVLSAMAAREPCSFRPSGNESEL